MSRVLVVGGGAAGMMAALAAAGKGHRVTLFEKNEKLGKKIYITGKGRCNVTNACEPQELFDNVVSNSKFLYSAFYGFDNNAVQQFFETHGCPLKTERGNRVPGSPAKTIQPPSGSRAWVSPNAQDPATTCPSWSYT